MIPFTEDLSSFYATIYGGLLIGLLFDINRSLKSNFKILKSCKENNILVSYDSNYRAKMWSLEEASEVTKEILPYVNIFSGGILDAENILNMRCDLENKYEKLKYYYV